MTENLIKFISVAIGCLSLSSGALAHGAVAVADDPKSNAWSVEVRNSEKTAEEARSKALKGCRERTIANKFDPDLCKIVSEFTGACASAFLKPTGTGEGWAVADTLDAAREGARKSCWDTAKDGNKSECAQLVAGCDAPPNP